MANVGRTIRTSGLIADVTGCRMARIIHNRGNGGFSLRITHPEGACGIQHQKCSSTPRRSFVYDKSSRRHGKVDHLFMFRFFNGKNWFRGPSGDLPMRPGEPLSLTVTLPNEQWNEVPEAVVERDRGLTPPASPLTK